jgi:alcohol dehydrogenase (cytochrome c)
MEGWLKAVDQTTGKLLWKYKTPSGIIGNPMTYVAPDGKQYVAVLSGIGGWAGIGVAAGIGAEDPTAGLGALGAFGDAGSFSTPGVIWTLRLIGAWVIVLVPLAWGVYETATTAMALLR